MEIVKIQIKEQGKAWDETPARPMKFHKWHDAVTFAYQLALLMDAEVRIESAGNGYYFHPTGAKDFLYP